MLLLVLPMKKESRKPARARSVGFLLVSELFTCSFTFKQPGRRQG